MKIIAALVGLAITILSIFFIQNCYRLIEIKNDGAIVKMKIVEIPGFCSGTKAKHYMRVRYSDIIFLKQIGANFCTEHNVGEEINMIYLKGQDQILFPEENVKLNLILCILMLLFGVFVIYYAFKTL